MEAGILLGPWINLQSHEFFQLGISHADFNPPEIIQRDITLHVILAVSCWVVPCLIQLYKNFSPGLSQTALSNPPGGIVAITRVLQERCMDQAPPERQWISSAQVKREKGDQKTQDWNSGEFDTQGIKWVFSFSYWRDIFVLYWPFSILKPFSFVIYLRELSPPNKAESRKLETLLTYLRVCVNLKVTLSQTSPAIQSYLL